MTGATGGADGADGTDGTDGTDGADGTGGTGGTDCTDAIDGTGGVMTSGRPGPVAGRSGAGRALSVPGVAASAISSAGSSACSRDM
ncbi:MAG TPA: hypothetical protein VGJ95_09565 [Pseudonocardiaceae bacterium]